MSEEKRIWSPEEDTLLKKLYEEKGVTDWSLVAKRMTADYNMPRKSAKQCRERYENHINAETAKVEWSQEEEYQLIQLHNEVGNKWSAIAVKLPGKTDNCVKNHFYSKLRKIIRRLNAVIHSHLRRQFREINISLIYKLVQATEEQFKEEPACAKHVSEACRLVQNKMLLVAMEKENASEDVGDRVAFYRDIVRDIYAASKMYKRKSKKSRNSSIQAPTVRPKRGEREVKCNIQAEEGTCNSHKEQMNKTPPCTPEKSQQSNKSQQQQGSRSHMQLIVIKPPEEQGYASDSSSVFDQNEILSSEPVKKQEHIEEEQAYESHRRRKYYCKKGSSQSNHSDKTYLRRHRNGDSKGEESGVVVASEQNMIKRLLKDSGLLRSDVDNIQTMQEVRRSHQSSFRNYSQQEKDDKEFDGMDEDCEERERDCIANNDHQFFDDSDADKLKGGASKGEYFRVQLEEPSDKSDREGEGFVN